MKLRSRNERENSNQITYRRRIMNIITVRDLLKRKNNLEKQYKQLEQERNRADLEDVVMELRVIKVRILEIEYLLENLQIKGGYTAE